MKPLYRIILFILICWFGYKAIRQTFDRVEAGISALLQYLNFSILILLTLSALVSDTINYRSYPKLFQFYSSLAGLLLCSIIFFRLTAFNKIDNSKTVLLVSTTANTIKHFQLNLKKMGFCE